MTLILIDNKCRAARCSTNDHPNCHILEKEKEKKRPNEKKRQRSTFQIEFQKYQTQFFNYSKRIQRNTWNNASLYLRWLAAMQVFSCLWNYTQCVLHTTPSSTDVTWVGRWINSSSQTDAHSMEARSLKEQTTAYWRFF